MSIKGLIKKTILLTLMVLLDHHGNCHLHTKNSLGFVQINGLHFFKNGKPLYLNGFNAYWMMVAAFEASSRGNVSEALEQASKQGMNVARTWAFNDGDFKPLQSFPGSYNEEVFKGLDFVVAEAGKYRVGLIMSLVNNFDDFGGRKRYVQWANGSDPDEFYTNPLVKQFYKSHVETVLTRKNSINGLTYKDDPTVFAWELMNEPRCIDSSGTKIQDWVEEMAAYIKSIDNNHLLEIGLEGFYGNSEPSQKQYNPNTVMVGTDFIANNQIYHIDFTTIHIYPEQWLPMQNSSEEEQNAFVDRWIQAHIQDCNSVLRKPLLVGEFGKSSKLPGYSLEKRNLYFARIYNAIYDSASRQGSCAGGIFWQLMTPGWENQGDGYQVVLEKSPSTANVIAEQSRRLFFLSRAEETTIL